MVSKFITAVLALTSMTVASPVKVYPEVIPGPGLPSLASLNLTSAQIHTMKPSTLSPKVLQTRFTKECGPVGDIIACYNYLNALGTTACSAPGDLDVVQMCSSGSGQVVGQSIVSAGASSYCRDVATAVLWVIDDCTRSDQSVAGFVAANGNGNLIIGGVNTDY